jgi:hypothetical protein
MIEAKPEFAAWATTPGVGWDGGNPYSPIWFCGIEPGGNRDATLEPPRLVPETGAPAWTDEFHRANDVFKWPFHQKQAKILSFYRGEVPSLDELRRYTLDRLLRPDGDGFHLNLFPFWFPRAEADYWTPAHAELSGLPTRRAYEGWCTVHRLPVIFEFVRKYQPAAVIAVGRSYAAEHRIAFLGPGGQFRTQGRPHELPSGKKVDEYESPDLPGTQVFLTPFLGQGGIMADRDLEALAGFIRRRPV